MATKATPSLGNETSYVCQPGHWHFHEEAFESKGAGEAGYRILKENLAFSVRMPDPKNPSQSVTTVLQGKEYIDFIKAQHAVGNGVYCEGHNIECFFTPNAKLPLDQAIEKAKQDKEKAIARNEAKKNQKWYQSGGLWFGVIIAAMAGTVAFIVSRMDKKSKKSHTISTSSSKSQSSSSTNSTLAASQENVNTTTNSTSNTATTDNTTGQGMSVLHQNATVYTDTPQIQSSPSLER